MTGSPNNLPRWLLSLETIICFAPLTWLFVAVLAMTIRGVLPLQYGVLTGSAALLGPLGVVVALRMIVLSGNPLGRITTSAMVLLAAWTLLAYSERVIPGGTAVAQWWRDFVLIALLPAWAVVRLLWINAQRRAMPALP